MIWKDSIRAMPGTIVSASAETINLYPFEGLLDNLVLVTAFRHERVTAWRHQGVRVFCLEEECIPDVPVNTGRLLVHKRTLQFLETLDKPVRILLFKPSADIEKRLSGKGISLLHPPASVARRLENKLLFPELAAQAQLDIPRTRQIVLDKTVDVNELFRSIGKPFIVQMAKGYSGSRTFFIENTTMFEVVRRRFAHRKCRVSEYIEGQTWTVNACVDDHGHVRVDPPFLQITEKVSKDKGMINKGSRGNLWIRISAAHETQIRKKVENLGKILNGIYGFKGIFGMDFQVSSGGRILGIELNPRPLASLPSLTPLEIMSNMIPLMANHLHVMEHGVLLDTKTSGYPFGGQYIIHADDPPAASLNNVKQGLYEPDSDRGYTFRSNGYSPAQLKPGWMLIWKSARFGTAERARIVFLSDSGEPPRSTLQAIRRFLKKRI